MLVKENYIFIIMWSRKCNIVELMISKVKWKWLMWIIGKWKKGSVVVILCTFSFVLLTHCDSCKKCILSFIPSKNSLGQKYGRELLSLFIKSISKSKADNLACHLAKIYFETKFLTSFL